LTNISGKDSNVPKTPKILWLNVQFSSAEAQKWGLPGGVGHYRQVAPSRYLTGFQHTHAGHSFLELGLEKTKEKIIELVEDHDLVFTKNLQNPWLILSVLAACDFYNKPVFVDFDDNVLTTDGKSAEKMSFEPGSEERYHLDVMMQEATAITVATKHLVDIYEPYNKNIIVLQNYNDPRDWHGIVRARRPDARLVIGWAASASHTVDHSLIFPVMRRIIKKYPFVVFSFMGHMKPEWVFAEGISDKNWCTYPGIGWWNGNPEDPRTYPSELARQGYDIGIAPLIESQFNNGRSLTKWYEYSMLEIPTVASRFGPYTRLGPEDALLCTTEDDWVDALSALIENEQLRKDYGRAAKQRVLSDFSFPRGGERWREAISPYIGAGFKKGG
jgi:glycosyltransferase involved in cell wall biosynthesis